MSQTMNEDLNVIANSDLEITMLDGDLAIIQKLDDEPNDVGGLTSAQLKAKFDQAGLVIQSYLNNTLIPELLAADATEATRAAAEAGRQAAEAGRVAAEAARVTAEENRESATSGIVAQATQAAQQAAASAEQAAQTVLGTIPDGSIAKEKLVQEVQRAVQRAASGGDIDASIQKKPNPNLLDNWYFGNPVDQRGGYVAPPGKQYYIWGQQTPIGTLTDYATVIGYKGPTPDDKNYYPIVSLNEAEYVIYDPDNVNPSVRGYTGHEMYGLDRWMITNGSALVVHDGYISAYYPSGAQGRYLILQVIENYEVFKGKQVTFSVLADHIAGDMYFVVYWNYLTYAGQYVPLKNGMNVLTCTIPDDANTLCVAIGSQNIGAACSVDLFAGKLELGSQQTLAHQDADGNWVLNEIPDYGEQLRRCQRYCLVIGRDDKYCPVGTGQARTTSNYQLHIPLPVSLRTFPTITKIGKMWVRNQEGVIFLTSLNFHHNLSQNCISLECSGESDFTPGVFYESFTIPGGKLIISADL